MANEIFSGVGLMFVVFGLFVFFTALLGLFRFDYVLNRMHAAAVGDALGIFCILIGLIFLHGVTLSAFKTLLILIFLWITSPVASHLIAEVEAATGVNMKSECKEERR